MNTELNHHQQLSNYTTERKIERLVIQWIPISEYTPAVVYISIRANAPVCEGFFVEYSIPYHLGVWMTVDVSVRCSSHPTYLAPHP